MCYLLIKKDMNKFLIETLKFKLFYFGNINFIKSHKEIFSYLKSKKKDR
jgi:hypothetical protein